MRKQGLNCVQSEAQPAAYTSQYALYTPYYSVTATTKAGEMTKQPTTSQLARAERMRLSAEAGAEARAHFQAQDIAVRKNMERLRDMRRAKEIEDAANPAPELAPKKRAVKKKLQKSPAA